MKTLRETCMVTGVTRRGLQWYEIPGLVEPSGHNERGYLLYDEEAIRRIDKIRLFQDFGFSVKEIKEIIDAPNDQLKTVLCNRLPTLYEKRGYMEETIRRLEELIYTL